MVRSVTEDDRWLFLKAAIRASRTSSGLTWMTKASRFGCGPRTQLGFRWSATSTNGRRRPILSSRSAAGLWETRVDGLHKGDTYKFRVTSRSGDSGSVNKADPTRELPRFRGDSIKGVGHRLPVE